MIVQLLSIFKCHDSRDIDSYSSCYFFNFKYHDGTIEVDETSVNLGEIKKIKLTIKYYTQ